MSDHNVFYPDWIPVDLALPIKNDFYTCTVDRYDFKNHYHDFVIENAFFDGKKFCSRFPVVSWCSVTIMPDCR